MLSDDELAKFKALLEDQHDFPSKYLFKFIVPYDQIKAVESLFPGTPLDLRGSKSGKYASVTCEIEMASADLVVAIYQKASQIKQLIAL